jgi:flagellin
MEGPPTTTHGGIIMGLQINTNVAAMNAYRNLSVTDGQMGKSLEKLSSGFRINRAADDAAGLAISEGLRSQIGGLKVAVRNSQDGVSVVQTAEGALTEVHSMLQRMRDLTVQAGNAGANGGAVGDAVSAIQKEIEALKEGIENVADRTQFNGTNLLQGGAALTFQVGANAGETLSVNRSDMQTAALGDATTKVSAIDLNGAADDGVGATSTTDALNSIDAAIGQVSDFRAELGAKQNQLEHTVNSLNVAVENLSASESRIRDTDMAQEMTNFTRTQILTQAGTAMLAQANQAPQGVLSLLR